MGNLVDMSEFQPCSSVDWNTFSKNVDVLFFRIQYGSSHPDQQYQNHVKCAKQYNLPFHSYVFPHFVSVQDARVEARDAVTRQDSQSLSICIDIEPEYDSHGNPVGITKLPYQVRLDGIKVYVDELRNKGIKKIGAYIDQRVYMAWGINTILDIFSYVWIPSYGVDNGQVSLKPKYPCDIHQYTSRGKIPGYNGYLDLNTLTGSKPLEYFTGKEMKIESIQQTSPLTPQSYATLTINYPNGYGINAYDSPNGNYKQKVLAGAYRVFAEKDNWYGIGADTWVKGDPSVITIKRDVVKVNYPAGFGVNVYDSPNGTFVKRVNGGDSYTVYAAVNGWYGIGANCWIKASDVVVSK